VPATPPVVRVQRPAAGALFIAALLLAAGCAAPAPGAPDAGRGASPPGADVEPPPANVNLSGFPLAYRQGYADGCASAGGSERRDARRYAADGNYRTGWTDGRAICGRR
jgi:hypothetical protein